MATSLAPPFAPEASPGRPVHATRAHLLRRLGRDEESRAAYRNVERPEVSNVLREIDRRSWSATTPEDVNMPSPEISFDADIKPLFREKDRDSMRGAFDLWSYADVKAHAAAIAAQVKNGTMPCDGAWPPDRVALLEGWIGQGTPE